LDAGSNIARRGGAAARRHPNGSVVKKIPEDS
jgi:hypothetical protein